MSTVTVQDVAAHAASMLRQKGWWRAGQHVPDTVGCICLAQSLWRSVSDLTHYWSQENAQELEDAVEARVLDVIGAAGSWQQVFDWNDAEGRTLEDVFAVLDEMRVST